MIRLCSLYLLFFAAFGLLVPWLPPLLAERGFSPAAIGVTLALASAMRVLLAPLWGEIADRSHAPRRLLGFTALAAGAALATITWLPGVLPIALAYVVYGAVSIPVMPMVDAATLAALGERAARYGRIRLWGSIGFVITALGFGPLVPLLGLAAMPLLAASCLAVIAITVLLLPDSPDTTPTIAHGASRAALEPLPWRPLLPVLLAAGLCSASHGPYYALFTLQLAERGIDATTTGALWAWGVIAEIVLMALAPWLLAHVSLHAALRWALALTVVRWCGSALQPGPPWLLLLQTLHAASFAMVHISAVQLIGALCPPGRAASGQAWLSLAAGGLGSMLGSLAAGWFGTHDLQTWPYVAAAITAALAWCAALAVRPAAPRS